MKSDFALAIKQLTKERNLPENTIFAAIEDALVSAYKKTPNAHESNVYAEVSRSSGEAIIYAEKKVVEDVVDKRSQISLKDAREIKEDAELDDMIKIDVTPQDFGRIAAQTAKQVIMQRIREAERDVLYEDYQERKGDIVTGTVQNRTSQGVTLSLGKTEAILPYSEQISSERYHYSDRIRACVIEVNRTNRGPQIIISRTHKELLRRLMELEVPEIYKGTVEIMAIAREAGSRSKIAVRARQEGIDPVGSCVGMRGVRIQSIVNELNGEKIDVVEWSPDTAQFVANALSPATVTDVRLVEGREGKTAKVVVPDKQLSLAIGKEGQNARLAAKLTGWRIDIKSETEAKAEARLQAEKKARLDEARALLAEAAASLEEEEPAEEVEPSEVVEPAAEEAAAAEAEAQESVEPAAEVEEEPVAEAGLEEAAEPAVEEEEEPTAEVEEQEIVESAVEADEELDAEAEEPAAEAEEEESVPEYEDLQEEEFEYEWEEETPKKKDKQRKRHLVYDEDLDEVVARHRRKPGRRRERWKKEVERWKKGEYDEGEEGDLFDVYDELHGDREEDEEEGEQHEQQE